MSIAEGDIKQATDSAVMLVMFQLFSRILTFILNTLVIRMTSPIVLGVTTIKLDLAYNTIIFLAREGLRRALLRFSPREDHHWQIRLVHTALLAIPSSIPAMVLMVLSFYGTISDELQIVQGRFWLAFVGYMIAAIFELIAEPFYLLCVHLNMIKARVPVESLALTMKTFTVLGIIWTFTKDVKASSSLIQDHLRISLIAYPLAQIFYSFTLVMGYYWILYDKLEPISKLIPIPEVHVDQNVLSSAMSMSKQVFLRYFLSQGDMWIVSIVAPLADQGVYAVVTNYGSLICRIILHPIEESTLCFLSQILSKGDQASLNSTALQSTALKSTALKSTALEYLSLILKLELLLSLLVITYGLFLGQPLIGTILGEKWLASGMPSALKAYCLLIPCMAFSGILEAFLHASIDNHWNSFYNITSITSTALFVTCAILGTAYLGPTGLIIANIVNFASRAIASWYYLYQYRIIHKLPPISIHYHPVVYIYFMILGVFNFWSSNSLQSLFQQGSLVIISTLPLTALVVFIFERPFLNYLKSLHSSRVKSE